VEYRGIQGDTWGYRRIHRMYRKIQGDRGPGIQGDPGGFERETEVYRGIQRDTEGWDNDGYKVVQ